MVGLLNVFNGGKLEIRDKYSFDLPEIKSERDWNKLVDPFLSNSEKFANQVEQMEESCVRPTICRRKIWQLFAEH